MSASFRISRTTPWCATVGACSAGRRACVRILKRIVETVGTTHIGLTFHFGGLSQDKVLKSMERCAKSVMPALR